MGTLRHADAYEMDDVDQWVFERQELFDAEERVGALTWRTLT